MAAEIIDLALVKTSRRCLKKLLDARGISYFLDPQARKPFRLDPSRMEMVVRTAVRLRPDDLPEPSLRDLKRCREEVRRELIQHVAALMLQVGL